METIVPRPRCECDRPTAWHLQVRLVGERRRLQCVIDALSPQVLAGNPMKVVVHFSAEIGNAVSRGLQLARHRWLHSATGTVGGQL